VLEPPQVEEVIDVDGELHQFMTCELVVRPALCCVLVLDA